MVFEDIGTLLGYRLLCARYRRNMTQAGLARAVGVSQTAVSYWESGHRTLTVEQLVALAAALHTTASELVEGLEGLEQPQAAPGQEGTT